MNTENNNIKVSIITICYNNEKDIRPSIESVLKQTYQNIEYIFVDGKSKDKTLEIVNEYKDRLNQVISEPDEGIYDAINKGIKASTGDIVGLVHAGDRLYNDEVISSIADHFAMNDIDASYGHSVILNNEDKPVRINKSPEFKKSLFEIGWMPSHQSIYLKRTLFEKLGYYRTDFGGSGDYEFVLRYFYFNDLKVRLLDKFVLKFALGGLSTSNYHKILHTQKVHIKCWEVNGANPPFYLIPLKLLRKLPQFFRAFKSRFI